MSRIISEERIKRVLQPSLKQDANQTTNDQMLTELHQACTETHKACMSLISRCIENETRIEPNSPEKMALYLACAQITHSSATLLSQGSPYQASSLRACFEICTSLGRWFSENPSTSSEVLACESACRKTSELCSLYLRSN